MKLIATRPTKAARRGKGDEAGTEPVLSGLWAPPPTPWTLLEASVCSESFQFRCALLPGLEKLKAGGPWPCLRSYFTTDEACACGSQGPWLPPDPKYRGPPSFCQPPTLSELEAAKRLKEGVSKRGSPSLSWALCCRW